MEALFYQAHFKLEMYELYEQCKGLKELACNILFNSLFSMS